VLSALDDFVGMAEAANLNTRTATLGGTWATSGAATDFTGATSGDFTADQIAQQAPPMVVRSSGLTTWRYAVLGSASFTDMRLTMAVPFRYSGTTGTTSLIARWVDSSNHLRFDLATVSAGVWFLRLVKVIAGVETVLASSRARARSARPCV
jgi:hypothetical protein